ncbi:MAG: helix-turn-helix domain-containing protein, partial [Myxococcota bacterium]
STTELDVMPPEGAAARSRRETRRRLVEAGTELFARDGLHGATSARIARRAGVAAGTFYLHFKDKQQLFREIVFAALAEMRSRQDRAAADVPRGGTLEVRARYRVLLQVAEENRSLIRVLFGRGPAAADLGEEMLDSLVPGIEERLRERAASGEAHGLHAAAAAQAIVGMVTRVIGWWAEDPTRAPREDVVETLTRLHPIRPRG